MSKTDRDEFMRKMLDTFPLATVDQDNEGQLVIYTGLKQNPDGTIEEFDTET